MSTEFMGMPSLDSHLSLSLYITQKCILICIRRILNECDYVDYQKMTVLTKFTYLCFGFFFVMTSCLPMWFSRFLSFSFCNQGFLYMPPSIYLVVQPSGGSFHCGGPRPPPDAQGGFPWPPLSRGPLQLGGSTFGGPPLSPGECCADWWSHRCAVVLVKHMAPPQFSIVAAPCAPWAVGPIGCSSCMHSDGTAMCMSNACAQARAFGTIFKPRDRLHSQLGGPDTGIYYLCSIKEIHTQITFFSFPSWMEILWW